MASEASTESKELLKQAIAMHRDGNLTHSESLYNKVLELDPKQTDALQLLGVIAAQLGNTSLAIERVNQSIAINPNQPGALNNLGNMLVREERYEEALDAFERAIHFDPDNAQSHFHAGHVFGYLNRHLDAFTAYTRATELDPQNATAWNALGASLEKLGRLDDAVQAYQKSIAISPEYIGPRDGLGRALRLAGRLDEAMDVYQQWLSIDPGNPIAEHFILVCGAPENAPERASQDYVKRTFDGFADTFDSLLSRLDYRVPEQLGKIANELVADQDRGTLRIVDLGCGTGLCGRYLNDLASHLVGVDLSPMMLAKARQRELYDELVEAELTQYLIDCSEQYDLMVSADTLIYIGDLRLTFDAAAAALRPGGAFVFSIEKLESEARQANANANGFQLGTSGRYQHTEACIRDWLQARGFSVNECIETEVRKEGLEGVTGYLFTATRNPTD
ncbi:Magnesium-protoporphyrin O-methyltransferase [Stieleria neptunia]|uniref:Magnesium-protoporphyrin O-methyltransferase n=1 Tax=Stieleria neptunia TaxID=2527979 RepID=A0A518HMR4_9BACT|nr:tetratricopeptide repeat protein [Stieleria neptunia]QDV42141.1 Magnesium-protoporphyrin O-methyltransferase [Stieleria neptunia]